MRMSQLALALLPLFMVSILISCDGANSRLTKEQVEEKITKDLPVGSDYRNVQQYLENHKIEYSWVEEEKTFYAIIRNTNGDFLVKENIQMIMHMDAEKKLKSIEVKSVFTGP
jgi:hypothetical protein